MYLHHLLYDYLHGLFRKLPELSLIGKAEQKDAVRFVYDHRYSDIFLHEIALLYCALYWTNHKIETHGRTQAIHFHKAQLAMNNVSSSFSHTHFLLLIHCLRLLQILLLFRYHHQNRLVCLLQ